MVNCILVVGYDRPHIEAVQKDWLRLNVYIFCGYGGKYGAIDFKGYNH